MEGVEMELGKFVEETVNALASAKVGGKVNVPVTFDITLTTTDEKVQVVKGQQGNSPLRLTFTVPVSIGTVSKPTK